MTARSDPYLDALEQLDQMRDRAFKAEAAIAQVREVCADQCFGAEHGPDVGLVNAVTVESILDALEGDSDE